MEGWIERSGARASPSPPPSPGQSQAGQGREATAGGCPPSPMGEVSGEDPKRPRDLGRRCQVWELGQSR